MHGNRKQPAKDKGGAGARPGQKPYAAPAILSVEALEAVAAPCEPPGFPPPTFGKGGPPGCINAQS